VERVSKPRPEYVEGGAVQATIQGNPAPFDMASALPFDRLGTQLRPTQDATPKFSLLVVSCGNRPIKTQASE
jgi:hypothetical protein